MIFSSIWFCLPTYAFRIRLYSSVVCALSDFRSRWGALQFDKHTQSTTQDDLILGQEDTNQRSGRIFPEKCVKSWYLSPLAAVSTSPNITHTYTHTVKLLSPALRRTHAEKQSCHTETEQSYLHLCFAVLINVGMFFPAACSEVSSPHTGTGGDIAEGVPDRLGGFFSTTLETNMSSLHHHHPVHTELLEIPTSPRRHFSGLANLCVPLSVLKGFSTGQCCSKVWKCLDFARTVVVNVKVKSSWFIFGCAHAQRKEHTTQIDRVQGHQKMLGCVFFWAWRNCFNSFGHFS